MYVILKFSSVYLLSMTFIVYSLVFVVIILVLVSCCHIKFITIKSVNAVKIYMCVYCFSECSLLLQLYMKKSSCVIDHTIDS